MMGKKWDCCRHATIDEDWRGSPKPWAVEEIVTAIDEKEVATVSIDDWTLEWGKRKSEDWIMTMIVAAFMVADARLVN